MRFALAAAALLLASPAFAEDAAEIWKTKCASCHGITGDAKTKNGEKFKVDDVTDPAWQARHSDEKIENAIAKGKSGTKMKAYEDKLSPAEIKALVAHIRSLKKEPAKQ